MKLNTALESYLKHSDEWVKGSSNLVDGVSCDSTHRLRVSLSLLHLCMEHNAGIHILVTGGIIGSAFALLRPQFEAYLRGVWFRRCATEMQIDRFLVGDAPPNIRILMEAVEKTEGFEDGSLTRLKRDIWNNLSDFTHGGPIQVKARNTSGEITSNYHPEHIAGLIQLSATLSMLAGAETARAVKNDKLGNDLLVLYKRTHETAP